MADTVTCVYHGDKIYLKDAYYCRDCDCYYCWGALKTSVWTTRISCPKGHENLMRAR